MLYPSPCKLSKLVDLSGKEVVLQPVDNKNFRTGYYVYAARLGRYYVLLNLAEANRIVENQLHRRHFSFLGKRKKVYREKIIEGYKVCYIVMSLNPKVKSIYMNEAFDRYCQLFHECLDKGMECRGFSIRLRNMVPDISGTVEINEGK